MSKQNPKGPPGAASRASGTSLPRRRLGVSKTPYEVGYGRPPIESRFKPGKSGNPSGRPKGAKNKPSKKFEKIKHLYSKIADEKITIRKGDKPARMSMMECILQQAMNQAVKGEAGMTKLVLKLGREIEQEDRRLRDRLLEEAIGYKKDWSDELMLRKMKGIHNLPDPIPHPDDVLIGRDGSVSIVGPMTSEEKKEDDEIEAQRTVWKAERADLEATVRSLMKKLKDGRCNPHRVRKELHKAVFDLDALKTWLKATSREARYGSK